MDERELKQKIEAGLQRDFDPRELRPMYGGPIHQRPFSLGLWIAVIVGAAVVATLLYIWR